MGGASQRLKNRVADSLVSPSSISFILSSSFAPLFSHRWKSGSNNQPLISCVSCVCVCVCWCPYAVFVCMFSSVLRGMCVCLLYCQLNSCSTTILLQSYRSFFAFLVSLGMNPAFVSRFLTHKCWTRAHCDVDELQLIRVAATCCNGSALYVLHVGSSVSGTGSAPPAGDLLGEPVYFHLIEWHTPAVTLPSVCWVSVENPTNVFMWNREDKNKTSSPASSTCE